MTRAGPEAGLLQEERQNGGREREACRSRWQVDLKLLKWRLNLVLMTWMIVELEKTQILLGVSTSDEEERKVPSVEEEVNRIQGSKGIEEVDAVKDVHKSGMEGDVVMCEHAKELGGEQSLASIKAPPQKKQQ